MHLLEDESVAIAFSLERINVPSTINLGNLLPFYAKFFAVTVRSWEQHFSLFFSLFLPFFSTVVWEFLVTTKIMILYSARNESWNFRIGIFWRISNPLLTLRNQNVTWFPGNEYFVNTEVRILWNKNLLKFILGHIDVHTLWKWKYDSQGARKYNETLFIHDAAASNRTGKISILPHVIVILDLPCNRSPTYVRV